MVSMSDTPYEKGSEGDMDHGVGYIDALLVVADEATPPCHPAEGSFDNPAPGENVEPFGSFDPAHDFDDELQEGGLVHQLCPIISAVGEEMFDPRPALADRIEDHLSAGAVGDISGRQVEHEQPAVGIDGDMAFAAGDLLAGVIAAFPGCRSFHGLAVDDPGRRARRAPSALAVGHQRDIVDRVEQEPPNEKAKPPVNRLPGRKIARQHLPAAPCPNQIADRVHHLPQIGFTRSASFLRLGQQRRNHRPLLCGHVGRVALELLPDLGHPATGLGRPHPKLESRPRSELNSFSKSLLELDVINRLVLHELKDRFDVLLGVPVSSVACLQTTKIANQGWQGLV
jgi:hypothetical protein